jgi:histone-lysine N-methyltransferase SETMAR
MNTKKSSWQTEFRAKSAQKMHKTRPQLPEAGPIILHDNTRPHIENVVTEKLRQYGWEVLPHAPYSPDMSPRDFDLSQSWSEDYVPIIITI